MGPSRCICWVPGKTKSTSLVYFFELNKPVLFSRALVGCTKRVTKKVLNGSMLAFGAL